MKIDEKIRDEKLKYNINIEEAKILELSSGKTYKYEYLTGAETLPSNKTKVIGQANFTYSPFGKAFKKQTKTIEEHKRKQIDAITNQNKRIAALTNKNYHKDNYKKYLKNYLKKSLMK